MAELGQKWNLSMKYILPVSLVFALVAILPRSGATPPGPATPAGIAFSKIKALAGEWESRAPKSYGNAVIKLNYRLISDDSVLVETFRIDEQDLEMLTVYHLDGQQLALTHYCAVNNQVRMLAALDGISKALPEIRGIQFNFRDGSNLEHSHEQVMNHLEIVFEDAKHFTQIWRWRDQKAPAGEDSAAYHYTRTQ